MNEFDYVMDIINKRIYELDKLVRVKGIYYDKILLSSKSYQESYEATLPQYKYIQDILRFINHVTNDNNGQYYVYKIRGLKWEYFEAIIHILISVIDLSFSIGYVTSIDEREKCHVILGKMFNVFMNIPMFNGHIHKILYDLSEFLGEYENKENEILEMHKRLQQDLDTSYVGVVNMYYINPAIAMDEIFCNKPRKLQQETNMMQLDKEEIDMICKRHMSQKALIEISQQIKNKEK